MNDHVPAPKAPAILRGACLALALLGGLAAFSPPAQAWWVAAPRAVFVVPPIVVRPPVYYAPPVVYAPPPPHYYAAPRRVWVPGRWNGPYWVPPHWS